MSDDYDPDNPNASYGETIAWLNKRISELEKNQKGLQMLIGTISIVDWQKVLGGFQELEKKLDAMIGSDSAWMANTMGEIADLSKAGVKWDFRLDEQGGFIDELREFTETLDGAQAQIRVEQEGVYKQLNELKEALTTTHLENFERILNINNVLRKLINTCDDEGVFNCGQYEPLLEKLDVGSARQTVKNFNDLPQAEKLRRWKELKKREREGYPEDHIVFLKETEKKEETEDEAQREADAEEAIEVAQYLALTKTKLKASGGDTSGVDKKNVTEDNDTSSLILPNDSKTPELLIGCCYCDHNTCKEEPCNSCFEYDKFERVLL